MEDLNLSEADKKKAIQDQNAQLNKMFDSSFKPLIEELKKSNKDLYDTIIKSNEISKQSETLKQSNQSSSSLTDLILLKNELSNNGAH
jgi:Mg2+ and Co2+ transporter CorA